MKNFFLIILLLTGCTALSQKISDLYGYWKFETIAEGTQVKDINQANAVMQSLWYRFYPDGTYVAGIMGVDDNGTFTFDGTTIAMKNPDGKVNNIELLAVATDRLTITLKKIPVHFKRVPLDTYGVKFIKKWKLAAIRVPGEEDDETPYPVPEGSSLTLNVNGTYSFSMDTINETGFWDYREKKGCIYTLILASGAKSKYWPVIRYSDTELVLTLNASKQEFVFVPL